MRLLVAMTLVFTAETAAFHYKTPLTQQELERFASYEILVTHDPLPPAQVAYLHARGTKLALYEWAVAFYDATKTPWQKSLRRDTLLNRTPLRGHLGSPIADAYYYDPAMREHAEDRAKKLASRLRTIGYDGVFLDATTSHSVHPDALAEYRRRHPDAPYDAAFAQFLKRLRNEVAVIVTNQGYREANDVLPYVDVDISESLITYPRDGHYVLRPWNDPNDAWNSTLPLMQRLIEPAQKKYPRVRFVHVNYVDDPKLAVQVLAISRKLGVEVFITNPSLDQ
ncbi:MAG TPA: hypothetical protein VMU84_01295 [Thermoanaerobaculia bacterium]|nr:hypothetical protein [Thermoanaerobaculia bacterium]